MGLSISGLGRIRMADRAFYALVALIAGLLAGLLGAVVGIAPAYYQAVLIACRRTWTITTDTLSPWSLVPVITLLFISAGSSVVLLRQWRTTQKLLRDILKDRVDHPSKLTAVTAALGVEGRVDLVDSEQVYAFCYGLRSPRICLTTRLLALLDEEELQALLLHERHHLESRDPLKVLLSRAFSGGLSFLPLARYLRDSYLLAKEIDADERTAAAVDSEVPLAKALLKVLSSEREAQWETVAAIGAFNVTEERVERLIHRGTPSLPRPSLRRIVASALIVGFIFGASYGPAQAMPAPTHDSPECRTETKWIDPSTTDHPECVTTKECVSQQSSKERTSVE